MGLVFKGKKRFNRQFVESADKKLRFQCISVIENRGLKFIKPPGVCIDEYLLREKDMNNKGMEFFPKVTVVAAAATMYLVLAFTAQAQFQVGVDYTAAVPVGDFAKNIDTIGNGVSLNFGYGIKRSPIVVGAEIGYVRYGNSVDRAYLTSGYNVSTSNNIFMTHGFLRVQSPKGPVRPYVEALIGLKRLYTKTTYQDSYYQSNNSVTDFSDTALSYGAGGGVMFLLYDGNKGGRRGRGAPFEVLLDLKARYLRGGLAQYLPQGSLDSNGVPSIIYQSRTDTVNAQGGITIRF